MEKRKKPHKTRKTLYPVSFMRQVVREMMLENLSQGEAAARFNLPSRTTAGGWYKKYSSDIQLLNTEEDMEEQETKGLSDSEKKVIELQKALQDANLKIAGLETMIDIAEEELKIDIRKKPGSKQPNK